jgi:uncharacterized damage-inducible protein DinB
MLHLVKQSFRWNSWANRQVLDALVAATAPPEKAVAAYQHVLETEDVWFSRMMEAVPNVKLWDTPDLARCARWTSELAEREARYFAELDGEGLMHTFAYQNLRGEPFKDRVDFVLQHVLFHSAQYRGEAAGFAHAAGIPVPDLDFIFWHRAGEPRVPVVQLTA